MQAASENINGTLGTLRAILRGSQPMRILLLKIPGLLNEHGTLLAQMYKQQPTGDPGSMDS